MATRASTDELALLDATAQAALVRSGEVTPAELVDAAIERIERVDPALNAVVIQDFDTARAAAASPDLPDGPLRGVPFLAPTAGCPPLSTADLWPAEDRPWKIGPTYGRIGRFTLPFNATGQPAVSLPLHRTPDGLPVGVQLVAGVGREDLLVRLAARLEEAAPWAHLRPQTHA